MAKTVYSEEFKLFMDKISKAEIEISELIDFSDVVSIRKIVNSHNSKLNSDQFENARQTILMHLNILRILCIARNDVAELDRKINLLFRTSKKSFSVLPYLLSKHTSKLSISNDDIVKTLDTDNLVLEDVRKIIYQSGLSKLFMDHQTKDLASYIYGVEAGLWSNNKKNQTGKKYEKDILKLFNDNDIDVKQQFNSTNLKNDPFDATKFIDFVVETKDGPTYLIEVNYYNSAGSKLNEIAKSYTYINKLVERSNENNNKNKNVFIWITDGPGWWKTRNGLSRAFENIEHLYTTSDFPKIVELIKSNGGVK